MSQPNKLHKTLMDVLNEINSTGSATSIWKIRKMVKDTLDEHALATPPAPLTEDQIVDAYCIDHGYSLEERQTPAIIELAKSSHWTRGYKTALEIK